MKAIEAISRLKDKLEKVNLGENLAYDSSRLIEAINIAQNKFTEWVLEKKNEDDIRLIERLVENKLLKAAEKTNLQNSFFLPNNFLELANILAKSKEGDCIDGINLWEAKAQNINEIYYDANN